MNFIQEVLNLLERKQNKKTLDLKRDHFQFGRTKPSSVGNPLYLPKMNPHTIRFDHLKCSIVSGLVEGTGTEFTLPMWSTVNTTNCNVQTLVDSVYSQNQDADLGTVSADLLVTGDTTINGNLLVLGTQTIIESTVVTIADNIFQINSGGAGVNAGIEVVQPSGTYNFIWDTANSFWSTDGESLQTQDIIIDGNIKIDGEYISNITTEVEGLASEDNDNSLPTTAAVIDWTDQMDLDVSADTGTPLDILLNLETLQIRGGSNITTNADGAEKIRIDLDDDIVVNSVTSKILTLVGVPGPYSVTSIVNDYAATVDPNVTLLTAKAIFNYVDDQRDYVQNVALNGTSLDFNGIGNAFGGSVDVSAFVNKKYTIEPTSSSGSFGIISLLEDGVVDTQFKVVGDNQWIDVASNGTELKIGHRELASVPITNQTVTLGTGDTFTTFEYVFDNAGHVVSKEEVDYKLNITGGGGSTPVMSSTLTGAGKLFSDVIQVTPAVAVTDESDRTYGVQFNNNGQLVVNVPWTQGTTYSASDGITLSGANDFSLVDVTTNNTSSSQNVNHSDSFTVIDTIATNSKGQVTTINTKTITLPAGGTGADGVVSNVSLNANSLEFTGSNGGFNGSVDLSAYVNAVDQNDIDYINNVVLTGNNLIFSGTGNGFAGSIDLSTITTTDTTYTLNSLQDANNVRVLLTGSDSSSNGIRLNAGTNITLTDDGSNGITIDAAAANAVACTGGITVLNSLQNLTSTYKSINASGTQFPLGFKNNSGETRSYALTWSIEYETKGLTAMKDLNTEILLNDTTQRIEFNDSAYMSVGFPVVKTYTYNVVDVPADATIEVKVKGDLQTSINKAHLNIVIAECEAIGSNEIQILPINRNSNPLDLEEKYLYTGAKLTDESCQITSEIRTFESDTPLENGTVVSSMGFCYTITGKSTNIEAIKYDLTHDSCADCAAYIGK